MIYSNITYQVIKVLFCLDSLSQHPLSLSFNIVRFNGYSRNESMTLTL